MLVNTGAPVSTPRVSVQPPAPSGKPIASAALTAPVGEGDRVPVYASDTGGASHNANSDNDNVNGDRQPGAVFSPGAAPLSPMPVDAIATSPVEPSGSENRLGCSSSEIAATKRRCAASLLAVIPRGVARAFFGVPHSSNSDRTCSAAIGSSSALTSTCPSSDPMRNGSSSTSPISSTTPASRSPDGVESAERTDETEANGEVDLGELFLLESIEADLLDLFADEYCNKHLVYSVIETVLAKLLPEMAERTVADLMEDRGVAPVPGGSKSST